MTKRGEISRARFAIRLSEKSFYAIEAEVGVLIETLQMALIDCPRYEHHEPEIESRFNAVADKLWGCVQTMRDSIAESKDAVERINDEK